MPPRLIRPTVGFSPTTPQALAGDTIEPLVSVPTATGARPAATAAAEPELEPDGLRPAPCGFTVWPPSVLQPLLDCGERMLAHSERLALPRITAPAARSRATRKASPDSASGQGGRARGGRQPGGRDVVLDQHRDALERAARGPAGARVARGRLRAAASGLTEITACRSGLSRSIRSR